MTLPRDATYYHYSPSGGEDIPDFLGPFDAIPNLVALSLDSGTEEITVTVTPSDVATPLGKKPWFAIFVGGSVQKIGQAGDGEDVALTDFSCSDTDKVTIKWRSAESVTNRLLDGENCRTVISMDPGS